MDMKLGRKSTELQLQIYVVNILQGIAIKIFAAISLLLY